MSNRSGTPYSAPTDADRRPVALGVSTVDGITPVPLEVNPSTGQLQVSSSGGGGGGGTSSNFSSTFPTTGTAIGATDGTNMQPLKVDGSDNLLVKDTAAESSLSTIATNTGNGSTAANQTNGNQKAQLYDPVSGLAPGVVAGDTGFNGVATAGASKQYTFTTSTAGAQYITFTGSNPTFSQIYIPCESFSWIEVVYSSVGSGLALTGQYAVTSGGTYINSSSFTANDQSGATSALGTSVNTIYHGPIRGNFFAIDVSALTSGTFTGTVTLRATAPPLSYFGAVAAQSGTWNVGSNATNSFGTLASSSATLTSTALQNYAFGGMVPITMTGTYSGFSFNISVTDVNGGQYYNAWVYNQNAGYWIAPGATISLGTNANNIYWVPVPANSSGSMVKVTTTALASGSVSVHIGVPTTGPGSTMSQIMDAAGNARGANVAAEGGLNVSMQASALGAFTYGHISTAATTTLKSGAGTLHNVSVNTLGTVASTATIYDNTTGSGTVIGVINTLNLSGSFILDVAFTTGLTIVTTGTIAPDLTVSYK